VPVPRNLVVACTIGVYRYISGVICCCSPAKPRCRRSRSRLREIVSCEQLAARSPLASDSRCLCPVIFEETAAALPVALYILFPPTLFPRLDQATAARSFLLLAVFLPIPRYVRYASLILQHFFFHISINLFRHYLSAFDTPQTIKRENSGPAFGVSIPILFSIAPASQYISLS
jgi:hypothetical protein